MRPQHAFSVPPVDHVINVDHVFTTYHAANVPYSILIFMILSSWLALRSSLAPTLYFFGLTGTSFTKKRTELEYSARSAKMKQRTDTILVSARIISIKFIFDTRRDAAIKTLKQPLSTASKQGS